MSTEDLSILTADQLVFEIRKTIKELHDLILYTEGTPWPLTGEPWEGPSPSPQPTSGAIRKESGG